MHWDSIEGQWKEMKMKVREKWGRLTDGEIEGTGGDRQKLESVIQHAYAKDRDTVRREVDEWAAQCDCPSGMSTGDESESDDESGRPADLSGRDSLNRPG